MTAMYLKKYVIASIALLVTALFSHAQSVDLETVKTRADSIQRIAMIDSLDVDNLTIDRIFSIRDSLMGQLELLLANVSLTAEQQNIQAAALRSKANTDIKNVLGDIKYEKYWNMIRNRLRQRSTGQEPLAGESGN